MDTGSPIEFKTCSDLWRTIAPGGCILRNVRTVFQPPPNRTVILCAYLSLFRLIGSIQSSVGPPHHLNIKHLITTFVSVFLPTVSLLLQFEITRLGDLRIIKQCNVRGKSVTLISSDPKLPRRSICFHCTFCF
jgi:hypothetical protein